MTTMTTGTEKQVKWAEDIRRGWIKSMMSRINSAKDTHEEIIESGSGMADDARYDRMGYLFGKHFDAKKHPVSYPTADAKRAIDAVHVAADKHQDAPWWIDNRNNLTAALAADYAEAIAQ